MSKRSRKTFPYTAKTIYEGRLKQKIVLETKVGTGDGGPRPSDEAMRRARRLQALKLKDLFELFGISRSANDRWQQLAVAIAINCVPGMQIVTRDPPKKGGGQRIWDDDLFVGRVDQLIASGTSKKNALREAALEQNSKAGTRSLQNRYSNARIKMALLSVQVDEFLETEPQLAKLLGL